jgi:hypothetical protein
MKEEDQGKRGRNTIGCGIFWDIWENLFLFRSIENGEFVKNLNRIEQLQIT